MTGPASPDTKYRAEPAEARILRPLDVMTLVYQRRSGITHIVAEPVPQILEAMGEEPCSAAQIAERLSHEFDLGDAENAEKVIADRLVELATLGLVERSNAA